MSTLYLIPVPIFDDGVDQIPQNVLARVNPLRHFVVENLKTARRVLRKYHFSANFDLEVQFFEWDKHSQSQNYKQILEWIKQGVDIGLMSEAGLPCIADPGNDIVRLAHQYHVKVEPLSGPTSIILCLISSGLNGQNFAFNGYLPIEKIDKIKKLKQLESRAITEGQTQIFMETPYRNMSMVDDVLNNCSGNLYLTIAANIGSPNSIILSKKISEWNKSTLPNIHKIPTVFCIGIA